MISRIFKFCLWGILAWASGYYAISQYEQKHRIPIAISIACVFSIFMMLRSFVIGIQLLSSKDENCLNEDSVQ